MTEESPQRSPQTLNAIDEPSRSIQIVPDANREMLSDKEFEDYYLTRKQFLEWLLHIGKEPKKAKGYSPYTVQETGYRTAEFDRWVWNQYKCYVLPPETEDADEYIQELAFTDLSHATKKKKEEAVRRWFRWLSENFHTEEWNSDIHFERSQDQTPQSFLYVSERRALRQAALKHGDIPSYAGLTPEERKQWKSYVARVLGKPAEDVSPEDWDSVDGWKITSLVWASLDVGLRPIEVGRAKTSWVDTKNKVLRIPREDSAKNEANWTVPITSRTATALDRWLKERENYARYEDTEALWLTTHGNPYGSKSLRRLLLRLCEDAEIVTKQRKISWYSIRHSVGTWVTKERDLAAAKKVLRHRSPRTTMKYDAIPDEDLREAQESIG